MGLLDIYDVDGEEAEIVYGLTANSWEDVETWDDVVSSVEKSLVSRIEEERRGCEKCPFLGKKENYFYYCGVKSLKNAETACASLVDERPAHSSAEYLAKVGHFDLQLWCMAPEREYSRCVHFPAEKTRNL